MKTFSILLGIAFFSTSFGQLSSGLVGKYYFDSGSILDGSGSGNDADFSSATMTTDRFGNSNYAYAFDGSEYINVPYITEFASEDMSVCVWFKSTSTDHARLLALPFGASSSWSILYQHPTIAVNSVGLTCTTNSPSTWTPNTAEATTNVSDGNWHFLVGVRNAVLNRVYIYIDCQIEDSTDYAGAIYSPDNNLNIGRFDASSGLYFTGDLDDIRIYNRPLSLVEMDSLCNEQNPTVSIENIQPTALGLVLYPNPTIVGFINIENFELNSTYEISNSLGQIVLDGKIESLIDVKALNSGVYFFSTIGDQERITRRFIVQ